MASETEVLVVGAGPVGLTLAIELARRQVDFRLVDRRVRPRPGTRGCTVWQRTLETFDLMGLPMVDFRRRAVGYQRRVYHPFGEAELAVNLHEDEGPYPLPLLIGQQETERALTERLRELGGEIERGVRAVDLDQDADGVSLTLEHGDAARETVRAGWVISAEGSHSVLRDALGIPWHTTRFGGTQLVQVDAFALGLPSDGPGEAHLYMTGDGFLGDLPLPDGRRRLFAAVADPDPENRLDPSVEEVEAYVRKLSGAPDVRLESPLYNWRVRLHNSVAAQFRKGRCFLLGDAARTVMPVTAQGMNTGIQDAFNLGWKLAAVITGAPDQLLDTYNAERLPVAHDLLTRTERSFWGGVGTPPTAEAVAAGVGKQQQARGEKAVDYKSSPLSRQSAEHPGLAAGDHAPQVALLGADGTATTLYDELRHGGWVLITTAATPGALPGVRATRLAATAQKTAGYYALAPGEALLIRPDGYVGYRSASGRDENAVSYLIRVLGG
ncbi:3-(3-hydroxyphenyl)propionate hydroxylase [Streptomyces kronopolitis]|uniref:3-(3-hydroxyphenyl)propionate hydroxylase n=1 Tax=Streptomyces kronopolitis TaxID=1612435 RepID=A0ABQ2J3W0_9ACTN|nr:FAD-dependent monooxygenase [Streptomyces kronopolitis]GGN36606.1 3-(3-hydroxyphenyl)propionate hydroxylase [Streptomyces kronopolitis]